MKRKFRKMTAVLLMFLLFAQIVMPLTVYALTSGPSQPEVQSFEPVGTTEMVDLFTGDFVYNIPLMDVEGYPINISYHSGVAMEQEASWVGLGWNINPGEINRMVRGVPDDFNGDTVEKQMHIKPEKNHRIGTGIRIAAELLGFDPQYGGLAIEFGTDLYLNFNNYKGASAGISTAVGLSCMFGSVGIDMGIGSQTGADADLTASVGFSSNAITKTEGGVAINAYGGTGFNTRSGLKDLSYGFGGGVKIDGQKKTSKGIESTSATIGAPGYSSSIPIGLQNYVPVISNKSYTEAFQFQTRFGGEVCYLYPNVSTVAQISKLTYADDGSQKAYGYLYMQNANDESVLDFSRDKDGIYNTTLPNLPLSSTTYDIYSVSGQGTGGMFRPYRNDIGSVYDPFIETETNSNDVGLEGGVGNLVEVGTDVNVYDNTNSSGPWKRLRFTGKDTGSLFENVFFKQGGELTYNQQQVATSIYNNEPVYVKEDLNSVYGKGGSVGVLPNMLGGSHVYPDVANMDRTSRANLLTYLTTAETGIPEMTFTQQSSIPSYLQHPISPKVYEYQDNGSRTYDPILKEHPRYKFDVNNRDLLPKTYQIGEMTQTLPDGRRYIYGLPAVNRITREATFSVNEANANLSSGLVTFTPGTEDSKNNPEGRENFYSSTNTPAYAYSYLLTQVLSSDYVDVTGDGATDDDPGSYVKFHYQRTDSDFRWRTPYQNNTAQYNPGFWSDSKDGKGNYIMGSREQWYLRSVESKNYVAEFYISPRNDGKGVYDRILPTDSKMKADLVKFNKGGNAPSYSYKLDSIKLYNKHDRLINESKAVPVKTVIFKYSYDLCKGLPNIVNSSVGTGKLTLQRIYTRYGNSQKSLLNPYVFTYHSVNPNYDFAAKDRWGNYKKNDPSFTNYEFPYTKQEGTGLDDTASAWNLAAIQLPSGGKINVTYESDDYSFVQDKRSMQMFTITGVGSTPNLDFKNELYADAGNINDYVYFKRRKDRETAGLSMKENYLDNSDLLYYAFNLDITGTGRYEFVKAYAKVETIDSCPNNHDYGYVKLKREDVKGMHLHPATVYGLNLARYYLPHILYPGYKDGDDASIIAGLLAASGELVSLFKNPFERFIRDGKGKKLRVSQSAIRLQTPGLTKKGGGARVKQLTLDDNWTKLSGNTDHAIYGKNYEYSIDDPRFGKISSGVASYEPLIGGDENPFRMPVAYTVDAGRKLPAIDFFQETPYGESFFPSPVVGYSKVTVSSIHASEGRSSQTEDEYEFYTAKDFPVQIDYTQKDAPPEVSTKTLRKTSKEVKVYQGYALTLNDMHGKAKSVSNYVIKTDGVNRQRELVTGVKYKYYQNTTGDLDNKVKTLMRQRGTMNSYHITDTYLGQEIDFTVDSRQKYFRSYNRTIAANFNGVMWGLIFVPIPSVFFPDKEEINSFQSMVSTKIIQQYGVLQSIEKYDHGARNTTENILFDGESGRVLLTRTNNEFNDSTYNSVFPAYLAYGGMGPAYLNTGYQEYLDSLVIDTFDASSYIAGPFVGPYPADSLKLNGKFRAVLYPHSPGQFSEGDELLVKYYDSLDNTPVTMKVWVRRLNYYTLDIHLFKVWIACQIVAEPRCLFYNNVLFTGRTLLWPGQYPNSVLRHVYVKVLRSGRKNNLNEDVQNATYTSNPYDGTDLSFFNPAAKALDVRATTYSDTLTNPYEHFTNSLIFFDSSQVNYGQSFSDSMIDYNPFVLGHLGNYRVKGQYVKLSDRNYSTGHVRYDGTINQPSPFWSYSTGSQNSCFANVSVLIPRLLDHSWKCVSEITRYDAFGNALEEKDAIGNNTSAQYGYNRSLPVAVAVNAKQREVFYDGFEDYKMLVPQHSKIYDGSSYYFSPFSSLFTPFEDVSARNVAPNQTHSNIIFPRYTQYYNLRSLVPVPNTGLLISKEQSHTGYYSLKSTAAQYYDLAHYGYDNPDVIKGVTLGFDKKYIVSLWARPNPTSLTNTVFARIKTSGGSSDIALQQKTNSIDGWYLLEATVTASELSSPEKLQLVLPSGIYLDDIRLFPADANMKSFVYNPYTFKLMAQLDENNMASLYEYDQEGLLVRTKKETERGILTVTENRRSSAKK